MDHVLAPTVKGTTRIMDKFSGGSLRHPWGNGTGAVANQVALEACVKACNEGHDLTQESNEIIREVFEI